MSLDVSLYETSRHCIFDANITHNMGNMAEAANIYLAVWRPEEIGIKTARELIPYLEKGIADMRARPEYFKKFDAPNGWGKYRDFLPWLETYLAECREHPDAEVEAHR